MPSHCGPGDIQILLGLAMWLILGYGMLADVTQSESERVLDDLELLSCFISVILRTTCLD